LTAITTLYFLIIFQIWGKFSNISRFYRQVVTLPISKSGHVTVRMAFVFWHFWPRFLHADTRRIHKQSTRF